MTLAMDEFAQTRTFLQTFTMTYWMMVDGW